MTLCSCFVLRLFHPSIAIGESDPLVIVCCCDRCGTALRAEIQGDGVSLNIAIGHPKTAIFFISSFNSEMTIMCNHLSCSIGMVGV